MQQKDARQGAKRQLFIFGQSMGGYTVVNYAARQQEEVKLAGVIALCPMLQIAPETRPPFIVEMVGRLVKSFGARLPLVHAIRGKVSDEYVDVYLWVFWLTVSHFYSPWVEERFNKESVSLIIDVDLADLLCQQSSDRMLLTRLSGTID